MAVGALVAVLAASGGLVAVLAADGALVAGTTVATGAHAAIFASMKIANTKETNFLDLIQTPLYTKYRMGLRFCNHCIKINDLSIIPLLYFVILYPHCWQECCFDIPVESLRWLF